MKSIRVLAIPRDPLRIARRLPRALEFDHRERKESFNDPVGERRDSRIEAC